MKKSRKISLLAGTGAMRNGKIASGGGFTYNPAVVKKREMRMGRLGTLMNWLFAKKDMPPAESGLADLVYTRMLRHNLQTVCDRHGEDDFVRVGDFLDALEKAVNASAPGKFFLGGDSTRTAAAHNIFNTVTGGKVPFLYAIAPDEKPAVKGLPIFPENCYVPVVMLAKRGLALLDVAHETMLADAYATALGTTSVCAGQLLRNDSRIKYEDGRGAERFTQGIVPHQGGIVSALYMRPSKPL